MAGALAVVTDSTGLLHVFTTRLSDDSVMTVAQTSPGVWGRWLSPRNPTPDDPTRIGDPAAFTEVNGNVTVFVRNLGTGVSAKTLKATAGTDNPFTGWQPAGT